MREDYTGPWKTVKNTVTTRLREDSLLHTLIEKKKIRSRTKLLNSMTRQSRGKLDYRGFVAYVRDVSKKCESDDETDAEPILDYETCKILHKAKEKSRIAERNRCREPHSPALSEDHSDLPNVDISEADSASRAITKTNVAKANTPRPRLAKSQLASAKTKSTSCQGETSKEQKTCIENIVEYLLRGNLSPESVGHSTSDSTMEQLKMPDDEDSSEQQQQVGKGLDNSIKINGKCKIVNKLKRHSNITNANGDPGSDSSKSTLRYTDNSDRDIPAEEDTAVTVYENNDSKVDEYCELNNVSNTDASNTDSGNNSLSDTEITKQRHDCSCSDAEEEEKCSTSLGDVLPDENTLSSNKNKPQIRRIEHYDLKYLDKYKIHKYNELEFTSNSKSHSSSQLEKDHSKSCSVFDNVYNSNESMKYDLPDQFEDELEKDITNRNSSSSLKSDNEKFEDNPKPQLQFKVANHVQHSQFEELNTSQSCNQTSDDDDYSLLTSSADEKDRYNSSIVQSMLEDAQLDKSTPIQLEISAKPTATKRRINGKKAELQDVTLAETQPTHVHNENKGSEKIKKPKLISEIRSLQAQANNNTENLPNGNMQDVNVSKEIEFTSKRRSRPRNLEEYVTAESLTRDTTKSHFRIKDVLDYEEIWIMDIPKTINPDDLKDHGILFGGKTNINLGSDRYVLSSTPNTPVSNISCVVTRNRRRREYHIVNVESHGHMKLCKKEAASPKSELISPEIKTVPFPKNIKLRHPLFLV